jgi:probable HAF family extracellular repeat protein
LCSNAVGGASAIHALLWEDGVPTDLGNLGGQAWNTPSAINNKGEIVGFSNTSGDENAGLNPHAFLWTKENGMQDLGTLSGDSVSEAVSINDQGQIVGLSCVDNTFSKCRGFLWQDSVMTDLNTLIQPGNLSIYTANDINSSGEIAGVAVDSATGEFLAMIAVPGPYNPGVAPSARRDLSASKPASLEGIIVPRVGLRSSAHQAPASQ